MDIGAAVDGSEGTMSRELGVEGPACGAGIDAEDEECRGRGALGGEEEARRAEAIRPDAAAMHVVHCAKCGRAVGECRLLPGTLNRYRCRRCGEWTWLVAIKADERRAQSHD